MVADAEPSSPRPEVIIRGTLLVTRATQTDERYNRLRTQPRYERTPEIQLTPHSGIFCRISQPKPTDTRTMATTPPVSHNGLRYTMSKMEAFEEAANPESPQPR